MIRTRGFTLVEVLVALMIAAVVAVMSVRGVGAMIEANRLLEAQAERWSAIQRWVDALEMDLRMALPRPGRDATGTPQPALLGAPSASGPFQSQLAIVVPDALGEAAPRRMAWRFEEGRIELLRWVGADLPPYEKPDITVALTGVKMLELEYAGADGVWSPIWNPAQRDSMPRGITIRLQMDDPGVGGPIERVIAR